MKTLTKPLILAALIASAGCGKDEDKKAETSDGISGIYSVTSQTKNTQTCDAEGPADDKAPAFYRIFKNSEIFPGALGWSSETCSSVDDCKDEELSIGILVFDTQAGDTWTGESIATATGGVNCSVTISTSTATKQSDGTFVIEVKENTGTLELTGDDCDPDSPKLQEKRNELTCSALTKVVTSAAQ